MRQHLASVLLASALGGCSLLYNPSNIPMGTPDAADAPIADADPTMLVLNSAFPSVLYEGTGTGGSRPAVLVIEGAQLVPGNTTVTITKAATAVKTPMIVPDNTKLVVDDDGNRLAVPVTLAVDDGLGPTESIALDLTVSQDSPAGRITKTLSGAVTLQGLAEIKTGAGPTYIGGLNDFSIVNVTSGTFTASGTEPIVINSRSSLAFTNVTINVNGSGKTGGPGGFDGGTGGSTLVPATAGHGPAPGAASGGAAGFVNDPTIATLDLPFRGSGGGGGQGAATAGSDGGGGGGSIALTAAGTLSVGAINATGGTPAANLNVGGGGSGGVILLRAGTTLMGGTMNVSGTGSAAAGRVRFDAGGMPTLANQASYFRGPMFVDPPSTVKTSTPSLSVSGTRLTSFKYYIINDTGQIVNGAFTGNIPDSGPATISFGSSATDRLFPGQNQVCLVAGGGDASSNTRNCTYIAYVHQP